MATSRLSTCASGIGPPPRTTFSKQVYGQEAGVSIEVATISGSGHLRQNPRGPHMSPIPPRATELCPLMGRQRWCRTRIDRSRFTERGNPVNPANKQHALFIDFRIAKCIGARVAGVLGPDTV